jgi:hypothetical protein
MQAMLPATVAPTQDPLEDGSVADFLTSTHNYERLHNAEASIPGALTGSKNKKKNVNPQVRAAVGAEIQSMMAEGTISAGDVRDTYQSSYDHGGDFGGEVGLNGVWGDEYVLHGHYNADGTTKPGSVGVKKASDPKGLRIAHGVDDNLGGDANDLFDHYST